MFLTPVEAFFNYNKCKNLLWTDEKVGGIIKLTVKYQKKIGWQTIDQHQAIKNTRQCIDPYTGL